MYTYLLTGIISCFAMQKYGCVTILCVSAAKASMEKLSKARPASKKNKDSKLKPLTEHDLSVVCMTSPLIFGNHDLHAALCLMSHIFINVICRKWKYSNLDTVGLCVLSSSFCNHKCFVPALSTHSCPRL